MLIKNPLISLLKDNFNERDLRNLCFMADSDYENFPNLDPADNAEAIVNFYIRRRKIPLLISKGKELKPDLDWPDIDDDRVITSPPVNIATFLFENFNSNELKELYRRIGADGLIGVDKNHRAMANEIVQYMRRRSRLPEIITRGKVIRPDLEWPSL